MKNNMFSGVKQAIGIEKKPVDTKNAYQELMWEATREYNAARQGLDSSEDSELIEYYIYLYKAAQAKLSYAIKMCRRHSSDAGFEAVQEITG